MNMRKNGFAFVELMMVVTVIGILSSITLVSINKNKEEKQVEVAARQVAAAIRLTQNYALTGKGPDASKFPCSYVFSATNNSSDYNISYNYRTGADCTAGTVNQPYIAYVLKDGVQFFSNSSFVFSDVSFPVPFGVTSGARYVVSKNTNSYTICVNAVGSVTENKGNVVCP